MKLAIVRQTYNPNGGAERFVSRALNVLAQDTDLDVTLIARQWEDAAGWKTLTVNPAFRTARSRIGFCRGRGGAVCAVRYRAES